MPIDPLSLCQVCLDGKVTTEKELDTVEVLKAIQKAKEAKGKMSSSDKKVLCPVAGCSFPLDGLYSQKRKY